MISAVILASGFAVRMEREKLLLPIDGVPMILKVAHAVAVSSVDETILIYRREEVKEAAGCCVDRTVHNSAAYDGQSEAIRLGLRSIHPKSSACLFIMGDQPLIQAEMINTLIKSAVNAPGKILVPLYGNRPGSPVLFPNVFWPELMQLRGDEGGRKVIRAHPDRVAQIPVAMETAGLDVDTWEEYQELLKKSGE
ncbi:MAG: nucleotidyltransferase family protein [Bacillota bacterium]|nr:nucleotidyltransferase family protein [Bacillota bacterium]MDW7676385.1 nucleotidyltransferase family protein [Bacillota bacterium]